jgi:DNA-binding MarR family transcriptional regulator
LTKRTQAPSPHIGRLFRDAFALFEDDLLEGLHRAQVTSVRPTHQAVLRYLDADTGTRSSTLAERAGLTRQALTQIVDDLERLGYVERRPDPGDRRAKLVVYTEQGREAFESGRHVIEDIERRYAELLGEADFDDLRAALTRLLERGRAT